MWSFAWDNLVSSKPLCCEECGKSIANFSEAGWDGQNGFVHYSEAFSLDNPKSYKIVRIVYELHEDSKDAHNNCTPALASK